MLFLFVPPGVEHLTPELARRARHRAAIGRNSLAGARPVERLVFECAGAVDADMASVPSGFGKTLGMDFANVVSDKQLVAHLGRKDKLTVASNQIAGISLNDGSAQSERRDRISDDGKAALDSIKERNEFEIHSWFELLMDIDMGMDSQPLHDRHSATVLADEDACGIGGDEKLGSRRRHSEIDQLGERGIRMRLAHAEIHLIERPDLTDQESLAVTASATSGMTLDKRFGRSTGIESLDILAGTLLADPIAGAWAFGSLGVSLAVVDTARASQDVEISLVKFLVALSAIDKCRSDMFHHHQRDKK